MADLDPFSSEIPSGTLDSVGLDPFSEVPVPVPTPGPNGEGVGEGVSVLDNPVVNAAGEFLTDPKLPGEIARQAPILSHVVGRGAQGARVGGWPGGVVGGVVGAIEGTLKGEALGRVADATMNVESPPFGTTDVILRPAITLALEPTIVGPFVKAGSRTVSSVLSSTAQKIIPTAMQDAVVTGKNFLAKALADTQLAKSASEGLGKFAYGRAVSSRQQVARAMGTSGEIRTLLKVEEKVKSESFKNLAKDLLFQGNSPYAIGASRQLNNSIEVLFESGFFKQKLRNVKEITAAKDKAKAGLTGQVNKVIAAADQVSTGVNVDVYGLRKAITAQLRQDLKQSELPAAMTALDDAFAKLGNHGTNASAQTSSVTFKQLNEAKRFAGDNMNPDATVQDRKAIEQAFTMAFHGLRELEDQGIDSLGASIAIHAPDADKILAGIGNFKTLNRNLGAVYDLEKLVESRELKEASEGYIRPFLRRLAGTPAAFFATHAITNSPVISTAVGAVAEGLASAGGQLVLAKGNRILAKLAGNFSQDITEGLPRSFKWLMENSKAALEYAAIKGVPGQMIDQLNIAMEQADPEQKASIVENMMIALPQLFQASISGAPSEYEGPDGELYIATPEDVMAYKRKLKIGRDRGELSTGAYATRLRELRRDGRLVFTKSTSSNINAEAPTPQNKSVKVGTKDDLTRKDSSY